MGGAVVQKVSVGGCGGQGATARREVDALPTPLRPPETGAKNATLQQVCMCVCLRVLDIKCTYVCVL